MEPWCPAHGNPAGHTPVAEGKADIGIVDAMIAPLPVIQ